MNCCDYNCHQGRDCPVRAANVTLPAEAEVREKATARISKWINAHPDAIVFLFAVIAVTAAAYFGGYSCVVICK